MRLLDYPESLAATWLCKACLTRSWLPNAQIVRSFGLQRPSRPDTLGRSFATDASARSLAACSKRWQTSDPDIDPRAPRASSPVQLCACWTALSCAAFASSIKRDMNFPGHICDHPRSLLNELLRCSFFLLRLAHEAI